ncbi:triacylglycerol lipase [Streptomyces sp. I05A-00742]|uniref:esterase/lipase family protein n=1 Tax=Streptomyces sp. I05A-00742 TaxID=2732853 RepID=UPI0014881D7E|nr:alpha/beta fold hydrolase [Streptomyces sp. I05A-00742]
MRGVLVAVLAAALGTTAAPVATPASALPPPPDPVVFVHGRNAGPGVWGSMREAFTAAGHPGDRLFAWSYDTTRSTNETLGAELSAYVDTVLARTGAKRVDLVAHSLGSLPARWYVKFGEGAGKVGHWASLAGPNHGTSVAYLCALWDQGCRDMTPDSYVLRRLNEGDETPGPVRYATWWSSCDEQIKPATSTQLSGAVNTATGCLKHNDLLTDTATVRQVRDFLTGQDR